MERKIGFHVSVAGGLPRAVERALERECTALQVFAGNPRGWAMRPRPASEIEQFHRRRSEAGLGPLFVHACYLVNPCAPDRTVYRRTVQRMARELRAAHEMGAEFYVLHPGSHKSRPPGWGVRRGARALVRAAQEAGRLPPVLLENTACGLENTRMGSYTPTHGVTRRRKDPQMGTMKSGAWQRGMAVRPDHTDLSEPEAGEVATVRKTVSR